MTLHDDLVAARALINTPRKWRRGGRVDRGRSCAWNALFDAIGYGGASVRNAERVLASCLPGRSGRNAQSDIIDFNDDPATTHADVMALFDRAIAAAKAQP